MQCNDSPGDTPDDSGGDGNEVGYRRPPKHARFRAGQSGNPGGRRRGVRNLMTDVKRTLRVPVKVKESGRSRKISTQEGALMLLREKALQGDARALDRLLELARLFNNDAGENRPRRCPPMTEPSWMPMPPRSLRHQKHKWPPPSTAKQRVPIPTRAWNLPHERRRRSCRAAAQ
jgi:hypothetical protein